MKIKLNNFQIYFFGLYLFFNTYSFYYILEYHETFGEFVKYVNNDELVFIAYILTVLPMVFFGWIIFPYFQMLFGKNQIEQIDIKLETKISFFIIILQISFLIFNLILGVNAAGSSIKTDSAIKYIFILLNPDIFFFILYGYARDNKLFKYNVMIYLVSSAQRGWMGGIFFVVLMELYIHYTKYCFSKRTITIASMAIGLLVLLLPYIVAAKWILRLYFGGSSMDLFEGIQYILNLGNVSYTDSLKESITYLFGRFQILSNVYLILEHLEILQTARNNGEFVSSFAIGLPQMLFYKLFGAEHIVLTSYFVATMNTKVILDELSSNTHIGYIGLILPEPYMFLFFLGYTILLVWLSVFLGNRTGGKYIHFISWYFLLVYLLQGWLQAYISYLTGLFMFIIVKMIIEKLKIKKI